MNLAQLRPNMSQVEWRTRVDLAALYRLVNHYGWSDLFGTHISARIPDQPNTFLLNQFHKYLILLSTRVILNVLGSIMIIIITNIH